MKKIKLRDIEKYVEENIGIFHQKRLDKLKKLAINEILKRKNPYLFKAKNIMSAHDLVQGLLNAYLQSQEETLFGDFMEGVAIFICEKAYGGFKSKLIGLDLEFGKNNIKYIVEVKSGPNWGNSSQIKKMKDNFENAKLLLEKQGETRSIIAVNGCCYGKDNRPDKGTYFKYCGQEFWSFISGQNDLYIKIIEPLGYKAKENKENFTREYAKVINKFTLDFAQNFCKKDGAINWKKLLQFNSEGKQ